MGVLLVAPDGRKVRIFTDCLGGSGGGVSNIDLTLDDFAQSPLPDNPSSPTPSGTYKPNEGTSDGSSVLHLSSFSAPAPSGPYSNVLTSLNGINPNGTWQLFVEDDTADDGGSISGWELSFQTPTAATAVISGYFQASFTANATVTMTDSLGNSPTVYSDINNYYELPPVNAGQTVILKASGKICKPNPNTKVINLTAAQTVNWNCQ